MPTELVTKKRARAAPLWVLVAGIVLTPMTYPLLLLGMTEAQKGWLAALGIVCALIGWGAASVLCTRLYRKAGFGIPALPGVLTGLIVVFFVAGLCIPLGYLFFFSYWAFHL